MGNGRQSAAPGFIAAGLTTDIRAVVLGAGGGLRSFAPAAVLAARGAGPSPGPARFIAWGAAAGELVADP